MSALPEPVGSLSATSAGFQEAWRSVERVLSSSCPTPDSSSAAALRSWAAGSFRRWIDETSQNLHPVADALSLLGDARERAMTSAGLGAAY